MENIFSQDGIWFWIMLQTILIPSSFGFIYWQIYLQRMANMIKIFDGLDSKWNSKLIINARKKSCENFINNNLYVDRYDELVLDFFETLGLFLRKRALTIDLLWEKYTFEVEHYWEILKPKIEKARKETGDETWFSEFEFLFNQCIKFSKKKKVPNIIKTDREIKKFIKHETEHII